MGERILTVERAMAAPLGDVCECGWVSKSEREREREREREPLREREKD